MSEEIKELFWIQEGTANGYAQMRIFNFEVERETPKTFIAKTRDKNSFGLKVVNKIHFNKHFFATALDALDAKQKSLEARNASGLNDYLRQQLKNVSELKKFNQYRAA